jgi:hypothetical protein
MPTVTLLAKAYTDSQFKHVHSLLNARIRGLNAKVEVSGITPRRWVRVVVSGEDEAVALRYLAEKIGICPESQSQLCKFSSIKGSIVSMDKNGVGVDVGILAPKIVDAEVSLSRLQAQLADGKKVALDKITTPYGFCESLPLAVKILSNDEEARRIEAMLDEKQVAQYRDWTKRLLDVLVVLGASSEEVNSALKATGSGRDIVTVEPLGLFEFAVVCKLGTNARGLIPQIGRSLRHARFSIFSPRRVLGFLEDIIL